MDSKTTTNPNSPKEGNMTPATITADLTARGYNAQRAGVAFVRAIGTKLNSMTPAERGQATVDAFVEALTGMPTTILTETDVDSDLGIRAAKIAAAKLS